MRSPLASIAILATLALAGCASPGAGSGVADANLEGQWLLVTASDATGTLDLSDGPPTLSNEGGEWGGTSPCNSFSADVALETRPGETALGATITRTGTTEVFCVTEPRYITALEAVTEASVGEALTLRGPEIELVFERLEPVDEQALVGRWTLAIAEVDGAAMPSKIAWIEFTPSRVSGNAGCRDFEGTWMVRGAVVHFDSFGVTNDGMCAPEVEEIESAVVSVLGDGFRVSLDDTLTLTSHRFEGTLVFTRG